jgi:alkylhydroperoxidase/carboxymuconolactone decarboxylase family protein YurZ
MVRKEAQTQAETNARVFQKQLKGIYEKKDPKALQATMDTLEAMPDVVKAIDWNKLQWGGEKAAKGGQGFADSGILGMLWNTPGALQNVGKGIANVGLKAAAGSDAPQVPYTEFTNPNVLRQQALKTGPQGENVVSEAPLAHLLDAMKFPNAVSPSQTTYQPQPGAGGQPEPYRYGTGNLPDPTAVSDQYAPAANFSRQGLPDLHLIPEPYQRPKMDLMVDDLLARMRQGVQAAPGMIAPPIDASQAATGGEEQALNENLSRLIAPNLSAIQESQYAPPASFPRQVQPPGFEYQEGYPSAVPGPWMRANQERYPYSRPPADFLSVLGL